MVTPPADSKGATGLTPAEQKEARASIARRDEWSPPRPDEFEARLRAALDGVEDFDYPG
jgi:hypothetical protein